MEFIAIAVIGVVLVALSGRKKRGRRGVVRGKPVRIRSADARKRTHNHPKASKPRSFDSKSAKRQTHKCVIKGSVFVIDGDTLRIKKTQIRLFGVDAPELNHPYGQKAKWALHALCKGRIVHAEIVEKDHYGRTVARCVLDDGRDLSAEMVKLGLAIDWPKFSGGEYRDLEQPDARKKLWLADARQKGRMHVWQKFEANQNAYTVQRATGPRYSGVEGGKF